MQQQHIRQSNNNPLLVKSMKLQSQNNNHPRNSNNPKPNRDRSSSSSKENHHQHNHHQSRRSRRNNNKKQKKNPEEQDGMDPDMWSPYGYHPQVNLLISSGGTGTRIFGYPTRTRLFQVGYVPDPTRIQPYETKHKIWSKKCTIPDKIPDFSGTQI